MRAIVLFMLFLSFPVLAQIKRYNESPMTSAATIGGILPAGNGGTGIANTATLTIAGSNPIIFTTSGSTSVTLPTSGTLAAVLSGTTGSIGGGQLIAGACTSGTVSIANSTTSMSVSVTPNTYPGDGAIFFGYVSTNGTVTVKVCGLVLLTPSASTYNVRVTP